VDSPTDEVAAVSHDKPGTAKVRSEQERGSEKYSRKYQHYVVVPTK